MNTSQRRRSIALRIAAVVVALVLVSFAAVVFLLRTAWFENYARAKVISTIEDSTGGKAELQAFAFDWTSMRATLTGLVVHGTEPVGAAPLAAVRTMTVDLKLHGFFWRTIDLKALRVDQPQVNVMVFPDGRSNIPTPKTPSTNGTQPKDVVDFLSHRIDIRDGVAQLLDQKMAFTVHGQDLRAHIAYNPQNARYDGEVAINSLTFGSGQGTPVTAKVTLPLVIERDSAQISNARIETPQSVVVFNAKLTNLNAPVITTGMNAHLAIDEARRGLNLSIYGGGTAPQFLDAVLGARLEGDVWQIQNSRVTLGHSYLELAGNMKDAKGADVHGSVALAEIAALLHLPSDPRGFVNVSGSANASSFNGRAESKDISLLAGDSRVQGFGIDLPIHIDASGIESKGLTLAMFDGQATLDARLETFSRLTINGKLRGLQVQTLSTAFLAKRSGYGGTIGGEFQAQADSKSGFRAQTHLTIAPNGFGTPVSGQIHADYSSAANTVVLQRSFLALPNTRINFVGKAGAELHVDATSKNLADFAPAIAMFSSSPSPSPSPPSSLPPSGSSPALKAGSGNLIATVRGPLGAPQIAGNVELTGVTLGQRQFDTLAADFHAASSGASVANGSIAGKSVQARFAGSLGLHDWSPKPRDPLTLTATIDRADLADVLSLAGQSQIPAAGAMSGDVRVSGTYGNPLGAANVAIANGKVYDQPFDRLTAQASLGDRLITLTSAHLAYGASTVDAQGTFAHPADSFETGHIQLRVMSNQVQLAQIPALQKQRSDLTGTAALNATLAGDLRQTKTGIAFVASNVDGTLNASTTNYGHLNAVVHTSGTEVASTIDSDFAGSQMHLIARTTLAPEYPTTADASIRNLPVERVMAIVAPERKDRGTLSATAHVSGTLEDPRGQATFELTKAVLQGEPVDRATGAVNYTHDLVTVSNLQVSTPAGQLAANGTLTHAGFQFTNSKAELHLASQRLDLARVQNAQQREPGLAGVLRLTADVAGSVREDKDGLRFLPTRVDTDGGLTGLQANGRALGDVTFDGKTAGTKLSLNLNSDLGKSTIHGTGQVNLTGNYETVADLTFTNLTYSGAKVLLGPQSAGLSDFDVLAEGQVHVAGPALGPGDPKIGPGGFKGDPGGLKGEVRLTRVELLNTRANPGRQPSRTPVLQNQGPIVLTLDHNQLRVTSAHITGRSTDLSASGTIPLSSDQPIELSVQGTADLKAANDVYPDLYSAGTVLLNANIRGSLSSPNVTGTIGLKDASMSFAEISNGLENANGEILLNGSTATIRTLTAESGGGKVVVTGNAAYSDGMLRPNLRVVATHVRGRYSGASVKGSGAFTLTGDSSRSSLAGNLTIEQVAYNKQSDLGSMLSQALGTAPVSTEDIASTEGFLANCHLQVRIRTAPDARFRTTLAEDIAGSADLSLRGSLASPGMTGRIDISSGTMVFFGHTYTVNRGAIAFYDATRIRPVLDLELVTTANSIQVTVAFSGPVDNLKLSYRSDPPLKFDDITALLTTNKTPGDATIAAHTPPAPSQSTVEMGESALLGQAIANPAASRLQRVFGVSQFKVDPSFAGGGALPAARVTIQQQVSGAITFTYTSDLSQANSEIVRVEWAINPRFSAVATRDEYGIFGIDFIYKKRFH